MLSYIVLACFGCGLLSMILAAALAYKAGSAWLYKLVAFSAGVLLASALLDVLPEALSLAPERGGAIFATVLAGLFGFFLLERAAIWRHAHADADEPRAARTAASLILWGDGMHNLVDGVLIAAAFLADPWLGLTTTLAVVVHEIPQELGDFALLLAGGWSRRKALIANGLSSMTSIIGGVLGFWFLEGAQALVPYALAVAAASFIYIAAADLVPLLHRRHRLDGFWPQTAAIAGGMLLVPCIGHWLH